MASTFPHLVEFCRYRGMQVVSDSGNAGAKRKIATGAAPSGCSGASGFHPQLPRYKNHQWTASKSSPHGVPGPCPNPQLSFLTHFAPPTEVRKGQVSPSEVVHVCSCRTDFPLQQILPSWIRNLTQSTLERGFRLPRLGGNCWPREGWPVHAAALKYP